MEVQLVPKEKPLHYVIFCVNLSPSVKVFVSIIIIITIMISMTNATNRSAEEFKLVNILVLHREGAIYSHLTTEHLNISPKLKVIAIITYIFFFQRRKNKLSK